MLIIRPLTNFLITVYSQRYMIWCMVVRDIRARYMGSFLGIFWSLIHPLIQLAIFYFIFSVVLKARLGAEYAGTHFAFWLISGLLPWFLFAEILNRAPGAVLEQTNLIKKTVFPSEILPLAHATAAVVNHLITVFLLIGFLIILGQGVSFSVVWLPFYLFSILIFALGLSWMVSSVNVFIRDVGQIIGFFVNIWFFLTPIIYPLHLIPEKFRPWIALNPMLYPVEGYRMALLGRVEHNPIGLAITIGCGVVVFLVGGMVFKKLKPAFADVL